MTRIVVLTISFTLMAISLGHGSCPDIVLIMADNIGLGDIGRLLRQSA